MIIRLLLLIRDGRGAACMPLAGFHRCPGRLVIEREAAGFACRCRQVRKTVKELDQHRQQADHRLRSTGWAGPMGSNRPEADAST
jgi:hypothetical protein